MSILPVPLHPAIVHLPIAIAVLAPLFVIGALVAIRRGVRAVWAWGVPVALLSILMLSGWAALQTGGSEGERVERTVGEPAVEQHEEAAEGFLVAAGLVLVISLAGFARGRVGGSARLVTALGTVGLLAIGYNVGHSGGTLVYGAGSRLAPNAGSEVGVDRASMQTGETGEDQRADR